MSELASEYGVHPITIGLWKKAVVQGLPRLFEGGRSMNGKEKDQTALIEKLYGKIGEIELGRLGMTKAKSNLCFSLDKCSLNGL